MRHGIDETRIGPYADHCNDGIVQIGFTLPVPHALSARRAALALAEKMGLARAEVVHCQALTPGYTYFILYGECTHTIDYSILKSEALEIEYMSMAQVEQYAAERIRRPMVVVGASTGSDTHSVGIDSMLNLKGFNGDPGLEAYRCFNTCNLGSQVPNTVLIAKAMDAGAHAILVSQTVTQQKLHIHNLTQLVDMIEAEGIRDDVILICGGPRITQELAKELGFDAGFSKGCYPSHLASFLVKEMVRRGLDERTAYASGVTPEPAAAGI